VLVAGGSYGQLQQTAELYDPATGRFSPVIGMPPELRDGFTATLLATGKALLAGGYSTHGGYAAYGEILASAELYDPTTNTIHPAGRMTTPRAGMPATLLADGESFRGGYTSRVTASAGLRHYHRNAFAATISMEAALRSATRCRTREWRVLIADGVRAELYKPDARTVRLSLGSWTQRFPADGQPPRRGQILIAGRVRWRGQGDSADLATRADGRGQCAMAGARWPVHLDRWPYTSGVQ
jgi:hypothetical protein